MTCQLLPSQVISIASYCVVIVKVVDPSIVSDELPSIVIVVALLSVFLIRYRFPGTEAAAGSVIVIVPLAITVPSLTLNVVLPEIVLVATASGYQLSVREPDPCIPTNAPYQFVPSLKNVKICFREAVTFGAVVLVRVPSQYTVPQAIV